ncbi:MAG: hypothetical protein ACI9TP_002119 [Candidatus Azotimanducaceae bacterium]
MWDSLLATSGTVYLSNLFINYLSLRELSKLFQAPK